MSTKKDFTEEEWQLLAMAPVKVAMCASEADRGLIAFAREVAAYPQAIAKALEDYKDNELVVTILKEEAFAEQEEELQARAEQRERKDYSFLEKLEEEVIKASDIAGEKATSGDAAAYRQMLHDIADVVVSASGEGIMGTGKKVSAKEAAFMEKLHEKLKLQSRA
jgi:hypothetical protein